MRLRYKWYKDPNINYRFLMPELTEELHEKYKFGTFDLAEFTFGPPTLCLVWSNGIIWKIPFPLLLLWRIENLLRLVQWALFLKGHYVTSHFVSLLRGFVFRLCDRLSWRVL